VIVVDRAFEKLSRGGIHELGKRPSGETKGLGKF
jgi:hypothetical protein